MSRPTRRLPNRREDRATTRTQILEAAGHVFAEKGFDRATGKEIAARAGSNSAAVNYYYGGIEGLYAEVLVEAHRRVISYDSLAALARAPGEARDKLRRLLQILVRKIADPEGSDWALRVLSRELLSPTPAFDTLREREVLPKKRILAEIVGEILGLPTDHPAVARSCISIMGPCLLLLVGDRRVAEQVFPELRSDPDAAAAMVEHFLSFAFGGLAAIARHADARRTDTPAAGG